MGTRITRVGRAVRYAAVPAVVLAAYMLGVATSAAEEEPFRIPAVGSPVASGLGNGATQVAIDHIRADGLLCSRTTVDGNSSGACTADDSDQIMLTVHRSADGRLHIGVVDASRRIGSVVAEATGTPDISAETASGGLSVELPPMDLSPERLIVLDEADRTIAEFDFKDFDAAADAEERAAKDPASASDH